jgi:anti-anti-sigma factor
MMSENLRSEPKGITTEVNGELAILRFQDSSLNFYVTDSLKVVVQEEVDKVLDQGCTHVVLSMEKVKILDSTGVTVVIRANNAVVARSAKLYVTNVKPFILKIFEILKISKHLSIFDTEEDAVAHVKETNDG